MGGLLPVQIVSPEDLRRLFNELQLWDLVREGLLHEVAFHHGTPRAEVHEPFGTDSQGVRYYNSWMEEVAEVHQYLRADGSLGASGLPDPKRVVEGRVVYAVPPRKR